MENSCLKLLYELLKNSDFKYNTKNSEHVK